ncbi:MAG: hypothetical protein Q8L10_01225 [Candidatus Moranbacteria bacterium]|nr:hypothetical protein [Candidatus Moranbacteria bacterium]
MDLQSIIILLYTDIIRFYHSGLFLVLKILLGIYTLVLFIDIVLLLVQRGIRGNMREMFTGMDVPVEITSKKKKMKEKWGKIRRRLDSPNETEYKVAIIEADEIIDALVAGLGYAGKNFSERLDNIPDTQIANIEGMRQAHEVRNRIIHDDKFTLSREDADIALGQYEELLRHFQVID